jgi:hypothetical protein
MKSNKDNVVKRVVRETNNVYYFSHKTVKQYEVGEIEFIDKDGNVLYPYYFGAGLGGTDGTLVRQEFNSTDKFLQTSS